MKFYSRIFALVVAFLFFVSSSFSQRITWAKDGQSYFKTVKNEIVKYGLPSNESSTFVSNEMLKTPSGDTLTLRSFSFSEDQSKMMIYANTKKVWRIDTQGDYWVLDLKTKKIQQVGKGLPESSLRFAKFSPDGTRVAYVSEFNVYMEDLLNQKISQLTLDGDRKLINGTFDWAYEEEFACRDGFQWSPDGQHISYWQIDARKIRDYYMTNITDSVYSSIIPVEYPTSGQTPSPARIGVINVANKSITWQNIPGDPAQHYLVRMEWNSPTEFFIQQLNRKQNQSKIYNCNIQKNESKVIYTENDAAWIDVLSTWENTYGLTYRHEFKWINNRQEFLWFSEKDGWRHLYRIGKDGTENLITKGDYDVMDLLAFNEVKNEIYFYATPDNATQKYLYKSSMNGKGKATRVTPKEFEGTNDYSVSPSGDYAFHRFNNNYTNYVSQMISLPNHVNIDKNDNFSEKIKAAQVEKSVEFFKIKIEDGTEMDAYMVKPYDFDASKKYPVVFYVYTEPWGANVQDMFQIGVNGLYDGDMRADGYIYVSIDNRGTPAPKSRAWRKSVYRKIGQLNISDQAAAAREILKLEYVDSERIAVWGWSGGGSATLNLMFQYPEIYKTGIAIAAVGNQLTYDNIYQERYMGLPQENMEDFVNGSPITYAKNLQGNLLYIHGTADDNVHYNNAEMLVNELIKHNKQFQFMPYPNRSHSLAEGEGTFLHLSTLYTEYLKRNCPGGGR